MFSEDQMQELAEPAAPTLKGLREKVGLTQTELAEKIDAAFPTIHGWEKFDRARSMVTCQDQLIKYRDALKVSNRVFIEALPERVTVQDCSEQLLAYMLRNKRKQRTESEIAETGESAEETIVAEEE